MAAIINGSSGDGETLAQDFKTYTGDTDKYHEYTVDNSMYLVKDQEDYNMVMKLSTIIGAQQVDVLIAPEYKFQEYVDQGGFYPMSELLTDEQQEAYKDQLTEYGLKVGDSEVLKAMAMQVDEDACLGVLTIRIIWRKPNHLLHILWVMETRLMKTKEDNNE